MSDKRLLVVDDRPELGDVVRQVASGLGYDVLVTSDGEGFMAAFDSFNPTAVMLDIIMPRMDGIELVRWLYDRGSKAKVLVASTSQNGYSSLTQTLGDTGTMDIQSLEKPYRIEALRDALTQPSGMAC